MGLAAAFSSINGWLLSSFYLAARTYSSVCMSKTNSLCAEIDWLLVLLLFPYPYRCLLSLSVSIHKVIHMVTIFTTWVAKENVHTRCRLHCTMFMFFSVSLSLHLLISIWKLKIVALIIATTDAVQQMTLSVFVRVCVSVYYFMVWVCVRVQAFCTKPSTIQIAHIMRSLYFTSVFMFTWS